MEMVTSKFKTPMHRVLIIHALAEGVGEMESVEFIESRAGKNISEGELVRLEKKVYDKVLRLRSNDGWPPKLI